LAGKSLRRCFYIDKPVTCGGRNGCLQNVVSRDDVFEEEAVDTGKIYTKATV
jgi:hypothetical protein